MSKSAIFFLVGVFVLSACGRDYNLDDYKREQLQESLAKMQQADGVYSGLATSRLDGSTLGALNIQVTTNTNVLNPGDQSDPTAQPNLEITVSFTGPAGADATVVFENGLFHPSLGGTIQAEKALSPSTNGTTRAVDIRGNISNGQFQGLIYSKDSPDYGMTFNLALNGPSATALLKNRRLSVEKFATQQNFVGKTIFARNVREPVVLILTKPTASSPSIDEFIDLLEPTQPLIATLNYGNGALLPFNVVFDERTGEITGTTPVSALFAGQTGSNVITLHCSELDRMKAFDCQLTTDATPGVAATTIVQRSHSTNEEPPQDNSGIRATEIRMYRGKMKIYRDGMVVSNELTIYFTALYEARTRSEEIYNLLFPEAEKLLQVSWYEEAAPDISTSFANAKWDDLNGTLDKDQPITIPSGAGSGPTGVISISCTQFYFTEKSRPFECHFTNTIGNVEATMKFSGRPIPEN